MFSTLQRLLTPTVLVRHVSEVPASFFQERGIRAVVTDLDNTLLPWHSTDVLAEEVLVWLEGLRAANIGVCLASNTRRYARLKRLAEEWGVLHVPGNAGKPGTGGLLRALTLLDARPTEAAMVGDQLFTDMVAGNRLGMTTVLVNPLSQKEFIGTQYISRNLERLVLRGERARPT